MFFVLFCFLSCSEHVLPLRVRHLIVFLRIFSKKNPSRGSSSHFLLYDLPVSGGQPHCCSLLSTPHTLALLMNPLLIFQMASALSACQHLGQCTSTLPPSIHPHPLLHMCWSSVRGAGSSNHGFGRGLAFCVRFYCSDQSLPLPLCLGHDWSISRAPLYLSVMRMSYCLWVCVYDWVRAASTGCSYKPLSA